MNTDGMSLSHTIVVELGLGLVLVLGLSASSEVDSLGHGAGCHHSQ